MRRLLAALRQKWTALSGGARPPVPFSISCSCGQVYQGKRGSRYQVVRCDRCSEMLFVLPRSPIPPTGDEDDAPPGNPTPEPPARSTWVVPLAAGAFTLIVVVAGLVLFFSNLGAPVDQSRDDGKADQRYNDLKKEGRRLLGEGGFRRALELLEEAREGGVKDRELIQLHRQARLLAHLLKEPLQDIVQKAQRVRQPEEWQAQFRDYKGGAILFDDWVRPDGEEFSLTVCKVIVAEDEARVRLNLDLLRRLPLHQPRRLIFGARLANVARGAGGTWEIEFEPDSGVLLTDEGAAAVLGWEPVKDVELRELLREQAEWAQRLP
jgi:hypothetical protein